MTDTLTYGDADFDGAGHVWPCGCSQHIGGDIDRCQKHRTDTPPLVARIDYALEHGWFRSAPAADVAKDVRTELLRLQAQVAALTAERDAAYQAYTPCAEHHPNVWEGDGSCTICEAQQIYATLAQTREALRRLREYAQHTQECAEQRYRAWVEAERHAVPVYCSCGLKQALADLPAADERT
jgi:hypothetical protein